jgi:thymidylate kinase
MSDEKLGPLIAVVGSDGSGKSTVGSALLAWLRESRPVAMCHLGKQMGDYGRALRKTPVLGSRVDGIVHARNKRVRVGQGPGTFMALFDYTVSMRRVRRFRRMMKIRRRGVTIIADRYPQTAVLNPKVDGPHFARLDSRNPLVRFLARRERAHYDRMASYRPNLVIRLNVDLETALKRKPDHRYESLVDKVTAIAGTSYQGAPILEIDSKLPLETVIAQAKQAVAQALAKADAEAAPDRLRAVG